MNLLEFSKITKEKLDSISDNTFAHAFIEAKIFYCLNYGGRYIASNSHGINFFDNVIKFWDNPDIYYIPKDKDDKPLDLTKKEMPLSDYEYNFIRILKLNKEASPEVVKFLSENETISCKSELLENNIIRWSITTRDKQKITFEHPQLRILNCRKNKMITLYRPVSKKELELVQESGMKKFPPRLPQQPIFYPVCNIFYAREINEKWNVPAYGSGYVLKFNINGEYIKNFDIKNVGDSYHDELWIPAEELEEFNNNIIGEIKLIEGYEK